MSTRTIGGTVQGANGTALASVPVVIELVLAEAFVVVGSYSVGNKLTLQTDAAGVWTTPLQCNDELTPVGTLYQVTEKIPGAYGGAKVYLIQVVSGLPVSPTVNQVLNLVVPAAVPVGGTYAPVGSGPQGIQGPIGPPGYVVVANNTALNALTKVEGLPVYVTNQDAFWVWDGIQYKLINIPRFVTQAEADTALNSATNVSGLAYYRASNTADEGPYYRNSNLSYTKPWHVPWGAISIAPGGGGTIALTNTMTTFITLTNTPLRRNRQYRCSGYFRASTSPANSGIRIATPGGTAIANTNFSLDHYTAVFPGANNAIVWSCPFVVTVDGNFTIPFQAGMQAVTTGTIWLDGNANITIEDIGPWGAPL